MEPYDFYTDFAAITVSQTGVTLILVRSLPEPRPAAEPGREEPATVTQNAEIVARVRFTPTFAVALRDLLNRTIEQGGWIGPTDDPEIHESVPGIEPVEGAAVVSPSENSPG
jgi:hypothetical protein